MFFPLYFGVWCKFLSRTRFCIVATHAVSWGELFGHYHPRSFLWRAILRSGTVCKFSLPICGSCICFSVCILGSGASFPHAQVEILYLLPQCGLCKSFSLTSFPRTDYGFPPCCELCLLMHFGTVVIRLGVVLASIGPKMT